MCVVGVGCELSETVELLGECDLEASFGTVTAYCPWLSAFCRVGWPEAGEGWAERGGAWVRGSLLLEAQEVDCYLVPGAARCRACAHRSVWRKRCEARTLVYVARAVRGEEGRACAVLREVALEWAPAGRCRSAKAAAPAWPLLREAVVEAVSSHVACGAFGRLAAGSLWAGVRGAAAGAPGSGAELFSSHALSRAVRRRFCLPGAEVYGYVVSHRVLVFAAEAEARASGGCLLLLGLLGSPATRGCAEVARDPMGLRATDGEGGLFVVHSSLEGAAPRGEGDVLLVCALAAAAPGAGALTVENPRDVLALGVVRAARSSGAGGRKRGR